MSTSPSLQAAGVPTVPGSDGLVRNPEEAFRVAKEVTTSHNAACYDMRYALQAARDRQVDWLTD